MTAKPPLHRSSACSTPKGAAAAAAAAAGAAAAPADAAAEDAPWPDAAPADAAEDARSADAAWAAVWGSAALPAAAAAASRGAPASSARARARSNCVNRRGSPWVDQTGRAAFRCGTFRVVCGRIAAGCPSTQSSDVGSQRAAVHATTFLQTGKRGFQWRL
jgi:hypothetical protein